MNILRRGVLGMVASLFFTTLLVFGLSWGLLRTFGDSGTIKDALAESGIYDNAVSGALEQFQDGQEPGSTDQIPLDKPELQNIIKNAASPDLLQAKTENALDSVYAWLHGDTPVLAFNLELGDIRTNLGNGVEQYLVQHISTLPECPAGTPTTMDDPFNATCLPRGLNAAQIASQAKNDFLTGEFMQDTTVSADNIKDENGQTLSERAENVQNVFKRTTQGVYVSGLAAVLLAVGVVLLSATWRSGVKKVSIVLVVIGVLTAVVSVLAEFGLRRAVSEVDEGSLQQSAIKAAELLVAALRAWWLWYGIGLVVLGSGALVALHFLKPKGEGIAKHADRSESPTGALPVMNASSSEPTAEQSPVQSKAHKPVKKLVQ